MIIPNIWEKQVMFQTTNQVWYGYHSSEISLSSSNRSIFIQPAIDCWYCSPFPVMVDDSITSSTRVSSNARRAASARGGATRACAMGGNCGIIFWRWWRIEKSDLRWFNMIYRIWFDHFRIVMTGGWFMILLQLDVRMGGIAIIRSSLDSVFAIVWHRMTQNTRLWQFWGVKKWWLMTLIWFH